MISPRQERDDLAADPRRKNVVEQLGAALRDHIQKGGATPWQRPH